MTMDINAWFDVLPMLFTILEPCLEDSFSIKDFSLLCLPGIEFLPASPTLFFDFFELFL